MMHLNQLFLDDFVEDQTFTGEFRCLSMQHFRDFASLTGDRHPMHYDPEYARGTRFGAPIAHGLHLMSLTALGAMPLSDQLHEAMIAFVEQGCRFCKPVLQDGELRPQLVVESARPYRETQSGFLKFKARLLDRAGDVILDGYHVYLIRYRPRAS